MTEIQRLMPNAFNEKLQTWEYILIDFRTPEEKIIYGYIDGTDLFIDVYKPDILEKLQELDKSKKYLIYCFHGNRTQSVLAYFKENNFEHAYDLIGWIDYLENYWFELKKD